MTSSSQQPNNSSIVRTIRRISRRRCRSELIYKCDQLIEIKVYARNGQLIKHSGVKDGKVNGHYVEFDEKGNLIRDCTMNCGKYHGKYRGYRLIGKEVVWVECKYKNGLIRGRSREYTEQGGELLRTKFHFRYLLGKIPQRINKLFDSPQRSREN